MMEFIKNSAFFGAMISLIAYEIGLILKKKFKMAIFNPLLISIICVIGVLLIFHIDYNDYNEGGKYISYLLERYFPRHNELCKIEGKLMIELLGGNESAGAALKALRGQTSVYMESVFGK